MVIIAHPPLPARCSVRTVQECCTGCAGTTGAGNKRDSASFAVHLYNVRLKCRKPASRLHIYS